MVRFTSGYFAPGKNWPLPWIWHCIGGLPVHSLHEAVCCLHTAVALPVLKVIFFYSWFQTFTVLWILYAFFWVIPWSLNFICQHFGTLCLFHLHRSVDLPEFYMPTFRNTLFHLHRPVDLPAYEDGTDRVFWNVGI